MPQDTGVGRNVVLDGLDFASLRRVWEQTFGAAPPSSLSRVFMRRVLLHERQCRTHGGLSAATRRALAAMANGTPGNGAAAPAGSVSAGSNRTATAIEMAQAGVDAGADAVLSVSPYYNKPTQEGLYQHYRAIGEKLSVPLFVYNVPARTSSNVLPSTLLRLSELEAIGGVKEASGNLTQVMELIRGRPEGFLVLSGEDSLTFAVVAHGGDGGIAVVANEAPESFTRMVHLGLDGAFEDARVLHDRLLPLMEANFLETNPIPVKAALEMMGRMEGHLRLPLTPLSEEKRQPLREALGFSKVLP